MDEVLFSGPLSVQKNSSTAEYICELAKKPEFFELKLYNQATFTIMLSKLNESEYYTIKETQSIRVNYVSFIATLSELLKRVQRKELFIEVGSTIKIIERNTFRNILHLELPLKNLTESEYKMYISEILSKLNRKTSALERENSILKEELMSARRANDDMTQRYREELEKLESTTHRSRREAGDLEMKVNSLKKITDESALEIDRLKKENRILEDDLKKANDIIKRNFEDLKGRIKSETLLKEETRNYKQEKEDIEAINSRLEMEVMEKNEEIKILKELEEERAEAINNLKIMNKSLNRKLESTYRIYNRIYKKHDETEEDTKTEETTSSLIAPESIQY
ncbi:hypothetical protein NEAUS03_0966 [Nematocida ausubeli]|nr:hypothetical protein NEAUS03_0966 [Nematocida ausubeli]